jgi:hypothetical protein
VENGKKTTRLTEREDPMEDGEQQSTPRRAGEEEEHYCSIHPDTRAFKKCPVCGKYFCARCLVHYYGVYYCEACGSEHSPKRPTRKRQDIPTRTTTAPTDAAPLPDHYNESPKARRALTLALVGLIPGVGLILDVIALIVTFGAFSELSEIRGMRGTGRAVAAMLIALVWLAAQLVAAVMLLQHYVLKASLA